MLGSQKTLETGEPFMRKFLFLLVPFFIQANNLTKGIPFLENSSFTNWAHTHECHPAKTFYPKNREDVQKIITEAIERNIPVKAVGSGHSMNNLWCTTGYFIKTDLLNDIISIDKKNMTVTAQCGIKMKYLFRILAKKGLAFTNQGMMAEQSIVGALATGTHGTGQTGVLSDYVIGAELIDGNGNFLRINKDENAELLPLIRVNLGALGFIYSITLQCEPLFRLKHKKITSSWDKMLEGKKYLEWYHKHDYFMFLGHPLTDTILIYTYDRTTKPVKKRWKVQLKEKLLMNKVMNYLQIKMAHWLPGVTNEFLDRFFHMMEHKSIRDYSYKLLSPLKSPPEIEDYIEEEIAIPIEHFDSAMREFLALYKKYEDRDFELFGVISCRFVKGTKESPLAPAYGRDSAYISINSMRHFAAYESFFKDFEAIMTKYDGRPHWGKFNHLDQAQVLQLYGQQAIDFNTARAKLDPNHLFGNEYLQDLFG